MLSIRRCSYLTASKTKNEEKALRLQTMLKERWKLELYHMPAASNLDFHPASYTSWKMSLNL